MGTPEFAVPSLKALIAHHTVLAVLTQPDRPSGRGHKVAKSPVKQVAEESGIEVLQPETLKLSESREIRSYLKSLGADVFVVAAYGLILPKGILEMPPLGCINVHGSLLPKYRGASPIHAALLNGDTETGITIIHMESGIDTGDMINKKELDITDGEHFPSLLGRMADLGADALLDALDMLEKGTAPREKQDDSLSCYAPMIKKTDGLINWNLSTEAIINQTRALDPWPGCYTMYKGAPLKIWQAEKGDGANGTPGSAPGLPGFAPGLPGEVLAVDPLKGVLVKTGDAALWITELQGEGSKRLSAPDYLRGRKIEEGTVFSC